MEKAVQKLWKCQNARIYSAREVREKISSLLGGGGSADGEFFDFSWWGRSFKIPGEALLMLFSYIEGVIYTLVDACYFSNRRRL